MDERVDTPGQFDVQHRHSTCIVGLHSNLQVRVLQGHFWVVIKFLSKVSHGHTKGRPMHVCSIFEHSLNMVILVMPARNILKEVLDCRVRERFA